MKIVVNFHAWLQHCSEFKLQSHFYVHFRINTLEKGMNSVIPQIMG